MKLFSVESMRDEKGFTLVELAVVMVIIGLLIGGILKGQEMIANQKVNSTITQIKALDAATSTFQDMFDAFPGDMASATTRIPGCAAPCADGNGDNVLASAPDAAPGAEAYNHAKHLSGADLVGGVAVGAADAVASSTVQAEINGRFLVPGYTAGGGDGLNTDSKGGHYFLLTTIAGDTALTGLEAARFDRKLDDGSPITGAVFGETATCQGQTDPADPATATGAYDEVNGAKVCDIWVRFNS